MRPHILTAALLAAALLASGESRAQQQGQPNPLDNIPEKMLFDLPFGAPINADRAHAAIVAAVQEAKKHDWKLNIAVVDWAGELVALERMDGAQIASIAISQHKARTGAQYRRETKAFEAGVQGGSNYLLTLDGIIASRGGIPLVEGGKIIGAIGCSGGTGSQDEAV